MTVLCNFLKIILVILVTCIIESFPWTKHFTNNMSFNIYKLSYEVGTIIPIFTDEKTET